MDKRKKFDYKLFKANDELARSVGKTYWNSLGRVAVDNPDKYGPDLVIDGEFYCEMEIKRAWKGKDFKYKTCQIPHRKAYQTKISTVCRHIFSYSIMNRICFFIKEKMLKHRQ